MKEKRWIIAIDGPSAAGKSTLGRALAERYGLMYIDTGAMYRAAAWMARQEGIDWSDEEGLVDLIERKPISLSMDKDRLRVFADGQEVTAVIRDPEIGSGASRISALPGVKRAMIRKQQRMGDAGGVIMDGRDIGTHVFPQAAYKFYLDASVYTRGLRRFKELQEKNVNVTLEEVISSMKERDYNDSHRSFAPLAKAPDAMIIDTTDMEIDEVLDIMVSRIEDGS
jgi:cytidylate kinase